MIKSTLHHTLLALVSVLTAWFGTSPDQAVAGSLARPPLHTVWHVDPGQPTLARWRSPADDGVVILPGGLSVESRVQTSGELVWRQRLPTSTRSSMIDGDLVYVGCIVGRVGNTLLPDFHALDLHTGEILWQHAIGGVFAHPVRADDQVFVASTHALVAINTDGTHLWTHDFPRSTAGFPGGPGLAGPAVLGDLVIVGAEDRALHAFDRRTGTQMWGADLGGSLAVAPVSIGHNQLVVRIGPHLLSLDVAQQRLVWQHTLAGDPGPALPTIDGTSLITTTGLGRSVVAIDLRTGMQVWEAALASPTYAAATLADELVLVGDHDGRLTAFDRSTGGLFWSELVADRPLYDPVVTGNAILVGADQSGFRLLNSTPVAPTLGKLRVSPNPARGPVRIVGGQGSISVYDIDGRLRARLSGGLDLDWDGTDRHGAPLPSGVYFLRSEGARGAGTVKLQLVR